MQENLQKFVALQAYTNDFKLLIVNPLANIFCVKMIV